jgi:hypothetical protein
MARATAYQEKYTIAMLLRLKTTLLHQISSYLTLTKKRTLNVFVKGIFGYLLRTPLRVGT